MSMTGSLMGYENNNDANQIKCKKPLKTLPTVATSNSGNIAPVTSATTATTTTISNSIGGKSRKYKKTDRRRESCNRGHANGLWSVWYGILAVTLQAYVATRCAKRFVAYLSLPWPAEVQPPKVELHACIVLTGTGVLLLPILVAAAFLKLGNLANDGVKLGRHSSTCTRDPPSSLLSDGPDGTGLASNLWKHGGPTAAFVHLCTAMCFLLPSLLMEARLIHAGFLPKDAIWRTDLDFVVVHRDRLVFLSFMNPPGNLTSLTNIQSHTTTSAPYDQFDDLSWSSGTPNFNGMESLAHETLPPITNSPGTQSNSQFPITFPSSEVTGQKEDDNPTDSPHFTVSPGKITDSTLTISPTKLIKSPSATPSPFSVAKRANNGKILVGKGGNGKARVKTKKTGGRPSTTTTMESHRDNMTGYTLPLEMKSLADLDHPEHLNVDSNEDVDYRSMGHAMSLEYLNYAMALGVYSVRYPAVFWSCNKVLGTIFSIQLVVNSAQSLMAYAGMSILYKVQVVGPQKVLPLMRHRTVHPTPVPSSGAQRVISNLFGDNSHFLLNPHVTLALFALSSLLVLCSSMVTYLYAYGRFSFFLEQERERRVIMSKETRRNGSGWTYFTHCAALCVFLAIAICNAPLLYDYTVVYRGSLDGAILACILSTVVHLILWLVLWFFLTIKRNWIFKVRVTIARATVRSARSVKLVTDVDLLACRTKNDNGEDDEDDEEPDIDQEGVGTPLLVVGDGKTYSIAEASPKRAIMTVIQRAVMERKARRNQGGNVNRNEAESSATEDEQIYWLRPKLRPSPAQSPSGNGTGGTLDKSWLNKKLRPKVTFNDLPSTSGPRNKGKRRGAEGGPEDDGDYATLRELPLMTAIDTADDSTSEENKLLECVNDDQVTYYANGNRDLQPSEGDPSPLLTPEPLPDPNVADLPPPAPLTNSPIATVDVVDDGAATSTSQNPTNSLLPQQPTGYTPRCLRRGDSGMPQDELTPRSDSSNSPATLETIPPVVGLTYASESGSTNRSNTSSNSETSSGVHSNVSNVSHTSAGSHQRRATSVDDLSGIPNGPGDFSGTRDENHWRSCSLQRGIQPPASRNKDFIATVVQNGIVATCQPFSQYRNGDNKVAPPQAAGCPAIILENANEATVVIRRRLSRPKVTEPLNPNDPEPFSRSTNMRMTSFTENSDLKGGIHASSATLPHYPTQPVVPTYPHCSTMPLPHGAHTSGSNSTSAVNVSGNNGINGAITGSSSSCGSVPQHSIQQNGHGILPPSHTTLPSHHNGMRIVHNPAASNSFVKRYPPNPVHVQAQPWSLSTGHHTFPQPLQNKFFPATNTGSRVADRDSANFSMASSGDSDICVQPH
ncbi:protein tincar isoform X2 [Diachasma alloeum]|uniref:protein tincar isoform X2 n=1 Tax=Diachasma alloeum TaxID=454923 RepID=UPI0007381751|nr:protein tincar isoform X2 [Diachasma alloeum]